MLFTARLHPGIVDGTITTTVRIWKQPRVKVGGRYRLGGGEVEVDAIEEIPIEAIDDGMARDSGFTDAEDLLATARHGHGQRVFLIEFHYRPPAG